MLHFSRGRSPVKMQKALANGRLPGVLPGAESPANLLIAKEPGRALAPGKCAPGTCPGSTPGKLCLHDCRLLQTVSASHQSIFKPCQEHCEGLTPGKLLTIFF